MKYMTAVPLAIAVWIALVCPTPADWNPDDPYKFLQTPDPDGWDVHFSSLGKLLGKARLADDFLCVETGLITDVHLWLSILDDDLTSVGEPIAPGDAVSAIHLEIYENLPPDEDVDYARPGDEPVWTTEAETFTIRPWTYDTGIQGWIWPDYDNPEWNVNDHTGIWQANIPIDPADAFLQQGTPADPVVYWLSAHVELPKGISGYLGWKTSLDTWGTDDANAVGFIDELLKDKPPSYWYPLYDPVTGESVNMAFVITPEPAALALLAGAALIALLAVAGAALIALARRRMRP